MMIVKRIIKITLLATVGGLILFWGVSIIKCEILTLRHKDEFIGLELQTNMLGPAEIIKVLNYSEETATIYYKEEFIGYVLKFRKDNNIWILEKGGERIWSKKGSADDYIWPYFR